MTQITGGSIRYLERKNLGNYEHKEAAAEIAFGVSEGDAHETMLGTAAWQAIDQVKRMIAGTVVAPAQGHALPVRVETVPAGPQSAPVHPAQEEPKKRGPGRPPRVAAAPDTATAPPASDPTDLVETSTAPLPREPEAGSPAAESGGSPSVVADPAAIGGDDASLFQASDAPVSDQELLTTITHKNGEIQDPPRIRELIGRYIPAPGQAREIDQSKRRAFLAELAALKKA